MYSWQKETRRRRKTVGKDKRTKLSLRNSRCEGVDTNRNMQEVKERENCCIVVAVDSIGEEAFW